MRRPGPLRHAAPIADEAIDTPPDGERVVEAAARVLLVDDDASVRQVVAAVLRNEGYLIQQASSAEEALRLVEAERDVPLVLSDLRMPDHDGLWLLEEVLRRDAHAGIVMLTGHDDTGTAVECLKRGAADYLLKPPRAIDLVRAIERAQSRRKLAVARERYRERLEQRVREATAGLRTALGAIEQAYESTLTALVTALDAREHETSDHSQRVVRYTLAIARKMGIGGEDLGPISHGALLHDIGKIGIPDEILLKPGPLTADEWVQMRRHAEIGHQILRQIEFLQSAADIVLCHQERWDGRGYPRGLKGREIPLGARVFAVADTLDAMTSDRPYRRAVTFAEARAEIARCSGSQFDPECVEAFLALTDDELLRLRNGASTEAPAER